MSDCEVKFNSSLTPHTLSRPPQFYRNKLSRTTRIFIKCNNTNLYMFTGQEY